MLEKYKEYLYLIPILLLGTILRFAIITKNSLWVDEIATITYSSGDFYNVAFGYMMGGEFNPPLFYIIEYFITSLSGVSEFTLRFIPCLAGILTIPIVYLISKKITGCNWLSYLNAFIFSVLPFSIYYSVEARCYSLALLLFLIGFYYYIDRKYMLASILFVLLTWTHFYGFVFILPFIIHYILKNRNIISKPTFVYLIGILPLAIPLYNLLTLKGESNVGWGLNYLDIIPQFFTEIGGMNILSGFILFCLFMAGLFYYKNTEIKLIFLLPIIITPILTFFINISTRYLIYFIPFYIIIITYPLMKIKLNSKINIKTFYIIFIIFMLIPGIFSVCGENKINYRGVADFIYENIDENSNIIIMPQSREDCFKYYYKGKNNILSFEPYDIDELIENIKSGDIIIKTGVAEYKNGDDIISKYLNKNCEKIEEFNLIWVYKFC